MSELGNATDGAVLAWVDQRVGRLRLNRPRVLNALDAEMIALIDTALDAWEQDPDVETIVLDGAGERGLCAGGDVRAVRERALAGDVEAVSSYFRSEYALNLRISRYPKPFFAFADGITMGGGIGLASHAAHRIVTERSVLAMPETRIGLTPDVGGSFLLSRAPGRAGEYLALTGATMDAADAIWAGFADHLVPADKLDALAEALASRADPTGPAELTLLFDESPEPSALAGDAAWIDEVFAAATVGEIVEGLRSRPEEAAARALHTLEEVSPTSLVVTLAAVRRARGLPDLASALEQEYRLVCWFALTRPDLPEGIRAQLVDKDRAPRWSPATIAKVPASLAEEALAFEPPIPLGLAR